MCRVVESRGNGYSWGCVYGCGNVVDYWNITYVSWQFSKKMKKNLNKKRNDLQLTGFSDLKVINKKL